MLICDEGMAGKDSSPCTLFSIPVQVVVSQIQTSKVDELVIFDTISYFSLNLPCSIFL